MSLRAVVGLWLAGAIPAYFAVVGFLPSRWRRTGAWIAVVMSIISVLIWAFAFFVASYAR